MPFLPLTVASAYRKEPAFSAEVPGRSGAFLLGGGVFLFLLSLVQGEEQLEQLRFIVPIVLSVVLLAAFVLVERKVKEPIMRPSLFRSRGISAPTWLRFVRRHHHVHGVPDPAVLLMTPVRGGCSASRTRCRWMLPNAIATLLFPSGIQARRTGAFKVLITGMAIMAVGFVSLIFLHSTTSN